MSRKTQAGKFLICFLILVFFISFEFFVVEKYNLYPWWHQFGWFGVNANDTDAVYPAQTIALLNNSRVTCITHPAATFYTFHGAAYRFFSLFNPIYSHFRHLSDVRNLNDATALLEIATKTSRILNFVMAVGFSAVLIGVIYELTSLWILTFFIAFYILISPAFFHHLPVVRPEMPSLFFWLAALWIGLIIVRNDRPILSLKIIFGYVAMGFLFGLSIFSKIQVLPLFFMAMLVMLGYLIAYDPTGKTAVSKLKISLFCGLPLLNLAIMPWWAVVKPAFLTPEYLKTNVHFFLLYGLVPSGFRFPFLAALVSLLFLTACPWLHGRNLRDKKGGQLCSGEEPVSKIRGPRLHRRPERFGGSVFAVRSGEVLIFLNAVVTGAILSAYFIFLPTSQTLTRYQENTQNLVYGVLTNVTYHGFLQGGGFSWTIFFQTIGVMHGRNTQFLGIHLGYIVIFMVLASMIRFIKKSTMGKKRYALALLFVVMGLSMDTLTTLRGHNVQDNYAIYSMILYGLGVAQWLAMEWNGPWARLNFYRISFFQFVMVSILGAHLLGQTYFLLTKPRGTGESDQNPRAEYINNRYWVPAFWEIVDKSIETPGAMHSKK